MLQQAIRNLKNQEGEGEGGFTLVELLVVILIIGILAAIAIPTFLGQRDKANDASSKSATRNAVSQVESYFTTKDTYVGADAAAPNGALDSSLVPVVKFVGTVGEKTFAVQSKSKSNVYYRISKGADGRSNRYCFKAAAEDATDTTVANERFNEGACNNGTW